MNNVHVLLPRNRSLVLLADTSFSTTPFRLLACTLHSLTFYNGKRFMTIHLKPINIKNCVLTIKGTTPLIQHNWSLKAIDAIRNKKLGKKTKDRTVLNAEEEFVQAMYVTEDGEPGIPVLAFKASLISAAHKDLGIEKVLVKKSIFIPCEDSNKVIPMKCNKPVRREDHVRVGTGGADLRYRPEFKKWSVEISMQVDADLLTRDDIVNLVNRAGFGIGLCDWRPEKGGEYGRFEVDMSQPITYSSDGVEPPPSVAPKKRVVKRRARAKA